MDMQNGIFMHEMDVNCNTLIFNDYSVFLIKKLT